MKKIFFLIILTIISFSARSQNFEVGKNSISGGYGIGNLILIILKSYNNYNNSFKAIGPIFGKYEYTINDQLECGVVFSYVTANVSYIDTSHTVTTSPIGYYKRSINWYNYSILMRFNWHFNTKNDKLDPYIGFGLGYRKALWEETDNDHNYYINNNDIPPNNLIPLGMEITAGMRFMVTDFLGVYAEVGLAKAVAQFGVVTKF